MARGIKITAYKSAGRTVAFSRGVQSAVSRLAQSKAAKAERNLAAVRREGRHHISTDKAGPDRYVNLEGPGALSVEAGHFTKSGKHVRGLNILRNT